MKTKNEIGHAQRACEARTKRARIRETTVLQHFPFVNSRKAALAHGNHVTANSMLTHIPLVFIITTKLSLL